MSTIKEVREFWNEHPLFTGESEFEPGTREFFEHHREICRVDCFAGEVDPRIFDGPDPESRVLDLGCGIGFWLIEFWERGFTNLYGADLSPKSLEIARQRCAVYGANPILKEENAEALSFDDAYFDHVNCQGVIHHTPDTERSVREIARVLVPGGTASISVYYRNLILRTWPLVNPVGRGLSKLRKGLRGRGRDSIFDVSDTDDIVRWYDGKDNPVGKAYSRRAFFEMLRPYFEVESVYYHFFPMRALASRAPLTLRRLADQAFPFMVYANVRKRSN